MAAPILSFRFFLYLVYAIVLTGVLLYVRFPAEKVKMYCEHRLERVIANGKASITKIDYHFPATVEFRKVKIAVQSANGKSNEIVAERLRLFPKPDGLLTSWGVVGELYSGVFEARLEIDLGENIFGLKDIRLEKADIAAVAAGMSAIQREIRGDLTVTGEYKAKFNQPLAGRGKGSLHLGHGTVQLVRPILTLDLIDFEEINMGWEYGDNTFRIIEGKMTGQQLDADFSGTLESPFFPPLGGLDLGGLLIPREEFLEDKPQIERLVQRLMKQYKEPAVPFRVGGTLNNPTFRLSV